MKKIIVMAALGLSIGASVSHSADQDYEKCMSIVKTHGFLSRTQLQCGIKNYSEEMLKSATICSKKLNENDRMESLKSGMKIFDRNEEEMGHDEACKNILHDFPKILSN